MVLRLMRPRASTWPNKNRIIPSHTLARLPRKISARSANRGPRNRPHCRSNRVKNDKNRRFLSVFQPLRPHTLTHINEIPIICSHILAHLRCKISAGLARRGPSNCPRRLSTRAKKGQNRWFLSVFQLLRPRTSTHTNEIPIICCHTLARLPHKISAGLAHRGPSKVGESRASKRAVTHSNDCRL